MLYPDTVIVGCGNPLYADDGFGPAVIQGLRAYTLPSHVKAIDAGTGGNEFVFSLLDPEVTRRLIVVDAAEFGQPPGSITLINLSDIHGDRIANAQPGGIATTLILMKDLMEINLIACQPKEVTYPKMVLGLSVEVTRSIPKAINVIMEVLDINGSAGLKKRYHHWKNGSYQCYFIQGSHEMLIFE